MLISPPPRIAECKTCGSMDSRLDAARRPNCAIAHRMLAEKIRPALVTFVISTLICECRSVRAHVRLARVFGWYGLRSRRTRSIAASLGNSVRNAVMCEILDMPSTVLRSRLCCDMRFVPARRSRKFSEDAAMMRCPPASHERNFGFLHGARCRPSGSRADCSLDQSNRLGDGAFRARMRP